MESTVVGVDIAKRFSSGSCPAELPDELNS